MVANGGGGAAGDSPIPGGGASTFCPVPPDLSAVGGCFVTDGLLAIAFGAASAMLSFSSILVDTSLGGGGGAPSVWSTKGGVLEVDAFLTPLGALAPKVASTFTWAGAWFNPGATTCVGDGNAKLFSVQKL